MACVCSLRIFPLGVVSDRKGDGSSSGIRPVRPHELGTSVHEYLLVVGAAGTEPAPPGAVGGAEWGGRDHPRRRGAPSGRRRCGVSVPTQVRLRDALLSAFCLCGRLCQQTAGN